MVKNPWFHCRGHGSIAGQGTKIPQEKKEKLLTEDSMSHHFSLLQFHVITDGKNQKTSMPANKRPFPSPRASLWIWPDSVFECNGLKIRLQAKINEIDGNTFPVHKIQSIW